MAAGHAQASAPAMLAPGELQRLNRLLAIGLELDADQQEAWLSGLGEESPAILGALRSALLESSGNLGTTGFAPPSGLAAQVLEELETADAPGDRVGPYRLIEPLGQGGMASVWLAERCDSDIRREVALKIPHPELADRGLGKRIRRECAVLASLNHPNIAHLYDADWSATGERPYLAMEVVRGVPIDEACAGLEIPARVRLFIDVLRAVAYAHARLVVHRDLKPSNVLVTSEGQVKLLDFGIAKVLNADSRLAPESELTRVLGRPVTLMFAAPEQLASGGEVTTATDIYALGAMLYQLLSGARACQPAADSRAAIEEAILHGTPALPSSRVTSSVQARALRGDLDSIVLKALEKAPGRRYQTADAFADDLERYLTGRVVQARRAGRAYRVQRFVNRNRAAVAMTAAVTVALLIGLTTALWQAREAARQAQIAAIERDRALASADHREALNEFMRDLLLEAGRDGKPVTIDQLVTRADQISGREFADDPELRAAVLNTVGEFRLDMDGPEIARTYFDQAERLLRDSKDAGLRASVGCARGMNWGSQGHYAEGRQAIETLAAASETPINARIECLDLLADLAIRSGDRATASHSIEAAMQEWEHSPRRSPMLHVSLLETLATTMTPYERPAKAGAIYEQALRELQQLGRERSSLGDQIREERIVATFNSGDPATALQLTEQGMELLAKSNPGQPPVFLLYQSCKILFALGRYAESLDACRKTSELEASRLDPEFYELALEGQASALSRLGRSLEAEEIYRRVAAGSADIGDQASRRGFLRLLNRARMDFGQGHYRATREGLARLLQNPACEIVLREMALRLLAEVNLTDHDPGTAVRDGREALRLGKIIQGDKPYSAWVGQSYLILGRAELAMGDRSAALNDLTLGIKELSDSLGKFHPLVKMAERVSLSAGAAVR